MSVPTLLARLENRRVHSALCPVYQPSISSTLVISEVLARIFYDARLITDTLVLSLCSDGPDLTYNKAYGPLSGTPAITANGRHCASTDTSASHAPRRARSPNGHGNLF